MKIRTSDGFVIDSFGEIRIARAEVCGNTSSRKSLGASQASKQDRGKFQQHQVDSSTESLGSRNEEMKKDILTAVKGIKLSVRNGTAYPRRGEVSQEVKENAEIIFDKLSQLCPVDDAQDKGEGTSIDFDALEMEDVLRTLSSVMQHMGMYSTTGVIALNRMTNEIDSEMMKKVQLS